MAVMLVALNTGWVLANDSPRSNEAGVEFYEDGGDFIVRFLPNWPNSPLGSAHPYPEGAHDRIVAPGGTLGNNFPAGITAPAGYEFVRWTAVQNPSASTPDFTAETVIDGHMRVYAQWRRIPEIQPPTTPQQPVETDPPEIPMIPLPDLGIDDPLPPILPNEIPGESVNPTEPPTTPPPAIAATPPTEPETTVHIDEPPAEHTPDDDFDDSPIVTFFDTPPDIGTPAGIMPPAPIAPVLPPPVTPINGTPEGGGTLEPPANGYTAEEPPTTAVTTVADATPVVQTGIPIFTNIEAIPAPLLPVWIEPESWALFNLVNCVAIAGCSAGMCLRYNKQKKHEKLKKEEDAVWEGELDALIEQAQDKLRDFDPNNAKAQEINDAIEGAHNEIERRKKGKSKLRWPVLSCFVSVCSAVLFILTQDMTQPMVIVDELTIIHGVFTAGGVATFSAVYSILTNFAANAGNEAAVELVMNRLKLAEDIIKGLKA